MPIKPPIAPFTQETAIQKVRAAEDAWNKQEPEKVAMAYTPDSRWRNRDTFLQGRDEIVEFLQQKWARELNYRLIKNSGRLPITGLPFGTAMNPSPPPASGIAHTAMRTGSSAPRVRRSIQDSVNLGCDVHPGREHPDAGHYQTPLFFRSAK